MLRATRTVALLLTLSLCGGCHVSRVRKIDLTATLTNDDNTLLTIEGQTNLPDGAEVEAILADSHGRRLAYQRGQVAHGNYFTVLDISRAPGFRVLRLDVFFDPLTATAQVQEEVGPRGEAISGPLVEESHDRQLVIVRRKLMLQMNAREAFLRKLESGDGDMAELESLLARRPDDPEALIGLGLAYLKQRPSERHPNSRAELFLKRGIQLRPRSKHLELQARLWISRMEAEARALAEEAARRQRTQVADPYHTESEIRPGEGMGAFHLGMPARAIFRHFTLDHDPGSIANVTQPEIFQLTDLPGIEVGIDNSTSRVSLIGTTDARFKTSDGVGIGTMIDDVRRLVPGLRITYGPEGKHVDGRLYSYGTVELSGLVLTFQRSVNPEFPLPIETVFKVQVVPLGAAPVAEPSPIFTPSVTTESTEPAVPTARSSRPAASETPDEEVTPPASVEASPTP